jgi:hypothetical protein
VEEQVRAGVMSREEAESSPFKNVITRSVGAAPTVHPDFYEEKAQPGDVWVLCSDGLTAYASQDDIATIVSTCPPSEAARQFIELANGRGGRDNITAFVLSVRALCPFESLDDNVARSSLKESKPAQGEEQEPFGTFGEKGLRADVKQPRPGWKRILGLG